MKKVREEEISYGILYMQNLKRNDTNEFTYKTKRLTDLGNKLMVAEGKGQVESLG